MRVCHVNLAFEAAPTGRDWLARIPTLTRIAGEQRRLGHDVHSLQRFDRDEDVDVDGVRHHLRRDNTVDGRARPWTIPRALLALARSLRPHIVHLNGLIFPVQIAQFRRALPRPTRLLVQHHGEWPAARRLRLLQRACLPVADGFIFNGADNAAPWRDAGLIGPKQPVHEVIEGSCDFMPWPQNQARDRTGMTGAPAVLWVGRLHRIKDPWTALRGFEAAAAAMPDAVLWMIFGLAPLRPEIEGWLRARPALAGRVRLIGEVPHAGLEAWYSAADLFLTSSPREGSNYALIESMSCGVIPVCSDIAAHRFIAGEFAPRFPVGDSEACAKAIVSANAIVGPAAHAAIRAHFESRLSYAAIAQQLGHAYATAVDDNSSAREAM